MLDLIKGWKTIAFNLLVVAAAVFAYLDSSASSYLEKFLPINYGWAAVVIIGVLNVILRTLTTTAVGKKY